MLASFVTFGGAAAFYYLAVDTSAPSSTTETVPPESRPSSEPDNLLNTTSPSLLAGIGSLKIDVLVFNERPALRFVLINMRRFGEGDLIAPDTRIEEITASGILVTHKGVLLRLAPRTYQSNQALRDPPG